MPLRNYRILDQCGWRQDDFENKWHGWCAMGEGTMYLAKIYVVVGM